MRSMPAFMQEGHAHQTSLDQDDILVLAIVLADDAAPVCNAVATGSE